MTSVLHVATAGSDTADGSEDSPFRTIGRAAAIAQPGDTVVVHAGEYREWVAPRRGGLSDQRRITYEAAAGEHVVIKGSEAVTGWEPVGGTVWKAVVPNALFGAFNPFAEEIEGDWIVYAEKTTPRKHLGDVYLNGRSFYEVVSLAEVSDPPLRTEVLDDWTGTTDRDPRPRADAVRLVRRGRRRRDHDLGELPGRRPEPGARRDQRAPVGLLPAEHHIDYITVRGFELAQAACPWTPPTADQPGLIGPNWAKGWIIEDNVIHDAKCSAVSLGKEASTGHNYATLRRDKPGYQYQLESVFSARQIGWDREHVGSHIVRRNTIYDCGQNGIVGHLGCVFSTIEDNHIYNIALKREFYGYEIAGIKLHAAIDVVIRHNRIHDCSLGIWLDWQTQGTRVSRNLLYANNRDLFVEVSHGPYLVEHNILASPASLEVFSQGGAFVNNLVCGTVSLEPVVERPTPYHVPHSTQVAGYAAILGGDDRHIGNVFLGGDAARPTGRRRGSESGAGYGTAGYNGHPASLADYLALVDDPSRGDHERFTGVKQPVYIRDNVYATGAGAYEAEHDPLVLDDADEVAVVDEGDEVYLETQLPEAFDRRASGSSPGGTSSASASWTRSSRNPTAARRGSTPTSSASRKSDGQTLPAGPIATLAAGSSRTACGDSPAPRILH